jgi:plastocyanin
MSEPTQPPEPASAHRDNLLVVGVALAALAFVASAVTFGFGARANDGDSTGVSSGGAATTASLVLSEFAITPASITVGVDGSLEVTNEGTIEHDTAVKGNEDAFKLPLIAPGDSATLDLRGLPAGTYDLYCTVPGHEAAGMKATLVISESGAGGGDTAAPPTTAAMTAEEMDASAHGRAAAFPEATEGEGGQVLEPTILPDGTKEFDLTVDVIQWEVEAGKFVEAWAYNKQIPGPTLKVNDGDKLRINVTNNLDESTTVHWHGVDVPNEMDGVPDVTQPQIKVGETYTYEFTVTGPAVGMYHSHSNSQKQVPMGLSAGMIIASLPVPAGVTVSQEIPFIVNDGGQLGFTINGKAFPATKPISAKVGETILVHYFNEGLQAHPMHLHGPTQTVIAKDGHPLPAPYEADTILVGPGERYSVLVTPNRPGLWAWHCHILTHAEAPEGLMGMTTVLIVE